MKSFDFAEKAATEVYGVAELESVLKILVAHVLGPLGTIFAPNFGITPEQRVIMGREPYHLVSRRILHMEAALLRKFWGPRNSLKFPYFSKVGGKLFRLSGHHFCTNFWHNSKTEGRTLSGTFPSCIPTCFASGGCTLTKIFGTTES